MKPHHHAFVLDVVSYFENHRPWKNDANLENEEDQHLYEKARTLAECPLQATSYGERRPESPHNKRGRPCSDSPADPIDEEIEDYLDAEEAEQLTLKNRPRARSKPTGV